MEIQFGIKEFNNYVNQLTYSKTHICYATNTIRIQFFSATDEKLFFFHIDPPWRIVHNREIIQSSYSYPYHSDYPDDQGREDEDFHAWCDKADFMREERIRSIILHESADLTIEWENNAILQAFINNIENPSYRFYDKVENKVYEFTYGRCTQDELRK